MTGEYPPAPGEPPAQPDDAPASAGQLRALRRWVAVAGVWAVAATAVALIALLDDDATAPRDDGRRVAADIGELQRVVDERIAQLERQVEDVASTEDLERLDGRLQDLEDDVTSASESAAEAADGVDALGRRVDELEGRIEALESESGGGGDSGADGSGAGDGER